MQPLRPYKRYLSDEPWRASGILQGYEEPFSEKLAWLLLRQLTDIPARGMANIPGTAAVRRRAYQEFKNFSRQGITYWDAASSIKGSAAALPYYYSVLNFAKAELVRADPTKILDQRLTHGLSFVSTKSNSIAGDYLKVLPSGVFPLLYQHRTGKSIPSGTRLRIKNLLSLIPEIGLEVSEVGRTRPSSISGYHSVVCDDTQAWPMLLVPENAFDDDREPLTRLIKRHFSEVPLDDFNSLRNVFALSNRTTRANLKCYQSNKTFSRQEAGGDLPNINEALRFMDSICAIHMSECGNTQKDFWLTPTVAKSKPLTVPLDLARYAAVYYLSSIVRYKPVALDPSKEGAQAWLMDSFAREVPHELLANTIASVRGEHMYFHPTSVRS
jgi:hypothetical protein